MGNERLILPTDSGSEQICDLFKHLFYGLNDVNPELLNLVKDPNAPIGIRNMAMKCITKDRAAFRTVACWAVGGLLVILTLQTMNKA